MDISVKTCELCKAQPSKYVCPRCGVPYCSLTCYKDEQKHLQCSESFYKDCVVDEMKAQEKKDPEVAKKMAEVLQRFHKEYDEEDGEEGVEEEEEEEGLDSDDDEPLEDRMRGIDLDDVDTVWGQLTEEERNGFKQFLKTTNVQDIVPEWKPWWLEEPESPKLIEEISEDNQNVAKQEQSSSNTDSQNSRRKVHSMQPDILQNIPTMASLTKVKPNEFVKRGLANVIASYVWTSRLYNGEFLTYENSEEVAAALITLSSFLSKDMVFATFEHALADVSMSACKVPELFDGGPALQSTLSKDVYKILTGPTLPNDNQSSSSSPKYTNLYVLSALTECYTLLSALSKDKKNKKSAGHDNDDSSSSFKTTFTSPTSILVDPKLLTKAKRKVHYLLAFANEFDIV